MSEEQVPPPPPESPPPESPPSPPESPPPPPPAAAPPSSAQGDDTNRIIMLVLAYFGPLALLPFFLEKEDQEIQWHAKHGLVLFGAELVLGIAFMAFSSIPILGCLVMPVAVIFFLVVFVFHVICIVKAINGERLKVPVLSDFADSF